MDPLTIIALIVGLSRAAAQAGDILGRVQRGETMTDDDRTFLKRQQAAAEADFDAAVGHPQTAPQ
jgi:alkylated DNA nucleotide flippase Atl1